MERHGWDPISSKLKVNSSPVLWTNCLPDELVTQTNEAFERGLEGLHYEAVKYHSWNEYIDYTNGLGKGYRKQFFNVRKENESFQAKTFLNSSFTTVITHNVINVIWHTRRDETSIAAGFLCMFFHSKIIKITNGIQSLVSCVCQTPTVWITPPPTPAKHIVLLLWLY